MKRGRVALLLCTLLLPLLLGGCWDKREVEQIAYVIALGVDESEQEGMLDVTYLIENPQVGSSDVGATENEPAAEQVTLTVPDWLTMRDTAEAVVSREIDFSHTRILLVGEEAARSGQLFPFLLGSLRDEQMSQGINLVVTRERASDFLQRNRPELETRPHKYYDLMALRWKANGMLSHAPLVRFHYRVTQEELFLAVYATTEEFPDDPQRGQEDDYLPGEIAERGGQRGNRAQFIGVAVFREGKMIGSLTGEEVRIVHFLKRMPWSGDMFARFPDPLSEGDSIAVRVVKSRRSRIEVDINHAPAPRIAVTVPVHVELLSIPSQINYASDPKKQEDLRRFLQQAMAAKAEALVKKTQQEFRGEPFLWVLEVRRHFWTWPDFENYHWAEQYPQADVKVKVEVTFTGFGKQSAPQPYQRQLMKKVEEGSES